MLNFYRFLPNCAQVLRPLTDLLKGVLRVLEWTAEAQESFQKAKQLLAAEGPIQHPSPTAELSLTTDASDTHINSVMQQKSGTHWGPLGFFSRYSTYDFELLAAKAAIKHFLHFCEGRSFSALDLSQTSCDRSISCVTPYFATTTAPFGGHFKNLMYSWCICQV